MKVSGRTAPARVTVLQLAQMLDGLQRTLTMFEQVAAEAATTDQWWRLQERIKLLECQIENMADEVQLLVLQQRTRWKSVKVSVTPVEASVTKLPPGVARGIVP